MQAGTSQAATNGASDVSANAELASALNQSAQGLASIATAGQVINKGTINVSGDVGGTVLAYGTQVGQFGTINADGLTGNGGNCVYNLSNLF